jgi:hypothetical protein
MAGESRQWVASHDRQRPSPRLGAPVRVAKHPTFEVDAWSLACCLLAGVCAGQNLMCRRKHRQDV